MILTFAKLQRISGLEKPKPDTVRKWLTRAGVKYLPDAKGRPMTTLDALNRKLQRMGDDNFILADPEGCLSEERALVQGRPESLDRAVKGRRRAAGSTPGTTRYAYRAHTEHGRRPAGSVPTTSGNSSSDEAGI